MTTRELLKSLLDRNLDREVTVYAYLDGRWQDVEIDYVGSGAPSGEDVTNRIVVFGEHSCKRSRHN